MRYYMDGSISLNVRVRGVHKKHGCDAQSQLATILYVPIEPPKNEGPSMTITLCLELHSEKVEV